ncbi:MAG: hypothetical protein F7C81_05635 [Desulfurococcales archaeon]|nr:hypothetical protein [Desulfurococcales archaeon]
MPCPYAQDVRGAVAYCQLARRKVSTLRFPCKGNYRVCPIYVRLAHIAQAGESYQRREQPPARPAQRQVAQETPQQQPAQARVERVEQPRPPEIEKPREKVEEEAPPKKTVEWGSGEAICDSLILALLISAASTLDVYRGDYQGLVNKLLELDTDPQSFLLLVGTLNGATVRATYKDYKVFSIMAEVEGETLCGGKALEELGSVKERKFDLVIYRVRWDALGGWKEYLLKELRG